MDLTLIIQLVIFVILMGLSGFFSSSETALFSLNRIQMEQMSREEHPRLPLIQRLLSEPRRLIVTILIGNELVNVAASNISATVVIKLMGGEGKWWVNIFIMLPLLLLVGEITPKTLAVRNNVAFSAAVSSPIELFSRLITPLRWVVRIVADLFTTLLVGDSRSKGNIVTEDMVRTLASEATKHGVLDPSEGEMINNIFDFGNQQVGEVKIPRAMVVSLSLDTPFPEILATLKRTRLGKVPIYDGVPDRIVGMLHYRDLLRCDLTQVGAGPEELRKALRKVLFVPETKPVAALFHLFRERKVSVALTLDEFGGITGLVTMEDLLESIFGEIRSESEVVEEPNAEQVRENCFKLEGSLPLTQFNQLAGTALQGSGAETVGGMLLFEHGELPEAGLDVVVDGWRFTILEVDGTRICQVLAQPNDGGEHCRKQRHPMPGALGKEAAAPAAGPAAPLGGEPLQVTSSAGDAPASPVSPENQAPVATGDAAATGAGDAAAATGADAPTTREGEG